MNILMSHTLWIVVIVLFGIMFIGLSILYYFLLKKTHTVMELKAFFSGTPIAMFFQDNKFFELKAITPINGIVYDKKYGPFVVGHTYVDKKTKNVTMAFDVDMDGDRTSNLKEITDEFRHITNNEKSINKLRSLISTNRVELTKNIENLTSFITYSSLKKTFFSTGPHHIKSKEEKIIAERVKKGANVNPMQAIIVFGAIFGIIVAAAILLKSMGIV